MDVSPKQIDDGKEQHCAYERYEKCQQAELPLDDVSAAYQWIDDEARDEGAAYPHS